MRLARVDKALEDCENHLQSTGSWNTEIEQLLTYSLLIIIAAELEQAVRAIIQEKCDSIEDRAIREFVESSGGAVMRSIRSSELAGLLNRFGSGYKADFTSKTKASPRAETYYNNLITNRNDTSHSTGSLSTFMEVKSFYEEGHTVLDFFRDTLLSINAGHAGDEAGG